MLVENEREGGFAIDEVDETDTLELELKLKKKYPPFMNVDVYTEAGEVIVKAWHRMFGNKYGVEFAYDGFDDLSDSYALENADAVDLWNPDLYERIE